MKIAIVTYSINIGGVETVMKSLATGFISRGHDVTFIETLGEGKWSEYFKKLKLNVLSYSIKWYQSKYNYVKSLSNILKPFDVILINDAPYAQSCLGLISENTIVFPILHNKIESMLNNATSNMGQWNKIIAISPSIEEYLCSKIDRNSIAYIPNGVELGNCFKKNSNSKVLQILFLGRLNHAHKGILYIPDILNEVIKYTKDIKLTMIGESTDDTNKLLYLIKENNLTEFVDIRYSLNHDSVKKIISNFDVLLFPSHFEGHPISLLEAMANGIVPIASNCNGQISHVIDDSVDGYLCEIGDVKAFANRILALFQNRSLLNEMSLNAQNKIVEKYSIDRMTQSYLDLFSVFSETTQTRSNKVEISILGEFCYSPSFLVRLFRKIKNEYSKVIRHD